MNYFTRNEIPPFRKPWQRATFVFPIALFAVFILMKIFLPEVYLAQVHEDSVVEYTQALFYLAAAVLAAVGALAFSRRGEHFGSAVFLILALGFFLVCGDEISWGQRLFHFGNPRIFAEYNVQDETSLHNLNIVQPFLHKIYILVGFLGAFAWKLMPMRWRGWRGGLPEYLIPDWFLAPYFFFVLLVYGYFDLLRPIFAGLLKIQSMDIGGFLIWRDQEPPELLLAVGFTLLMLRALGKIRTLRPGREGSPST